MTEKKALRKLTTILAADVVGYSRLVAADETGTIRRFKRFHDTIFRQNAARYNGRVVKLMGDGLLMEFGSVVDAVNFASDVQHALASANADLPDGQRMDFRMGVNIGDVIIDKDDILGNGVNVAARLEGLAEPGGICLSGTVFEHVNGKVGFAFETMGDVTVKNIPGPITAYRLVPHETGKPGQVRSAQKRVMRPIVLLAACAVAITCLSGYLVWRATHMTTDEIARSDSMVFPLPDKPSIVVLPVESLSDDNNAELFADGITEDLITDLSKVSGLFVIASNSSFPYKGEEVSIGTIAEQLGVRYVLKGSVRQSGGSLRVNTQLIDTTTGAHVWAERFDGEASDIFSVQDQIVVTTVDALRLNLTDVEKSEISKAETRQLDAKAAFQQGWALYSRFNEADNARSVPYFKEAIRRDPEYGRAHAALALVYLRGSAFGWDKALGEQEASLRHMLAPTHLKEAERHGTALVHVVRAMQDLFYRHTDEPMGRNRGTDDARRESAAAIALQPSDPEAHVMMGWALIAAGQHEEGLNFVAAAKRLNPNFPSHYSFFEAAAQFGMRNPETAASVLREELDRNPDATELAPLAASVFASLGLRDEAAEMVRKWRPDVSESDLEFAIAHYRFPITWVEDLNLLNTRLIDGLRLAVRRRARVLIVHLYLPSRSR